MTPIDLSKAAAAMGKRGGKSTSEAKRAASRENGKRGGRPRKDTTMANKSGDWSVAIFDRDERGEFHRASICGLPSKKACIAEAQTWTNKTRYEITNPSGKVTNIEV